MKRGNTKEEIAYLGELHTLEMVSVNKGHQEFNVVPHKRRQRPNQIIFDVYVSALLKVDKETARQLVSGVKQGKYFRWMFDGGVVYKKLHGKIDYPLLRPYPFTIKTDRRTSIGDVLWEIAQIYKTIYEPAKQLPKKGRLQNAVFSKEPSENPHGVWGHDIGDLVFEMMTINEDRINLYIGS